MSCGPVHVFLYLRVMSWLSLFAHMYLVTLDLFINLLTSRVTASTNSESSEFKYLPSRNEARFADVSDKYRCQI